MVKIEKGFKEEQVDKFRSKKRAMSVAREYERSTGKETILKSYPNENGIFYVIEANSGFPIGAVIRSNIEGEEIVSFLLKTPIWFGLTTKYKEVQKLKDVM